MQYGDHASTLAPPTDAQLAAPHIAAADAYNTYVGTQQEPLCSGSQLSITFGQYSNSQTQNLDANGNPVLAYVNKPEWLVECTNVTLPFAHPANVPSQPVAPQPSTETANVVEVIDATSGKLMLAFSYGV